MTAEQRQRIERMLAQARRILTHNPMDARARVDTVLRELAALPASDNPSGDLAELRATAEQLRRTCADRAAAWQAENQRRFEHFRERELENLRQRPGAGS